jgi:hypothetical protein
MKCTVALVGGKHPQRVVKSSALSGLIYNLERTLHFDIQQQNAILTKNDCEVS